MYLGNGPGFHFEPVGRGGVGSATAFVLSGSVPGHVDFLEGSNLYEANLLLPEEGAEMPHVTPMFPAERPVDDQNIKCIRGGVATSGSPVSKTAKHTLVGVLEQVTIARARDRFTDLGWLDGNKTNAIVALRRFALDLRFWCLGRFFLSVERLNALGVRIVASLLVGSFPSVLSSIYHSISPKSTYLSAQRCSQNRCLKSTCRHLRVCRSTILVQNWYNEAAWSRLQQEHLMFET